MNLTSNNAVVVEYTNETNNHKNEGQLSVTEKTSQDLTRLDEIFTEVHQIMPELVSPVTQTPKSNGMVEQSNALDISSEEEPQRHEAY